MKKALLISCFNWYNVRLRPIRELLIDRGYEVIVLESDFDHIKKTPIEKKYPECTYINVPEYKSNLSLARIRSHLYFGKMVSRVLAQEKPDVIVCQIPPNNVANHCRKYKISHPDVTLILDIIDLWPESMPLKKLKSALPLIIWSNWRDKAIKNADHVFTECDLYQEKLKAVLDLENTNTLPLYKDQSIEEKRMVQEIIKLREAQNSCGNNIKFAYLGSMNNIIDIDGICSVIKTFQNNDYSCEVHAIGDGENRERFAETVRVMGCKAYFYGPIFDEIQKIKILTPCDYALNMMKGDISVGLTIKSIDYLSYGLPLLNNIKGDTWKLIDEKGIGVNFEKGIELVNNKISHGYVLDVYNKTFARDIFEGIVDKALQLC